MKYNIAWMFPDILFMHGERGNVSALERYAKAYEYEVCIDRIDFETKDFNSDKYDAIVYGVGEISTFKEIIEWHKPYREELLKYIESGRPMLVTGTSQSIFADEIIRTDGTTIKGLSFYSAKVVEKEYVYGDDIIINCNYNSKEMKLAGSQIMMFDFSEDKDKSFGELIYGYGNNGQSKSEGHIINNAIFTNILGPLLVCNPWITIEMIKASSNYRKHKIKTIDESFDLEYKSLDAKINFNLKKSTNLTNCK